MQQPSGTLRRVQALYSVHRGAVPTAVVEGALRVLHLDLIERGVDADELGRWIHGQCWWPHLRHHPAVLALAAHIPAQYKQGEMAEPQLLCSIPHTGEVTPLVPHTDVPPPWAAGRQYTHICGVALSAWHLGNGCLHVWPYAEPVLLGPGDVVAMDPALPHASGHNMGGALRYSAYFRWLGPAGN